MDWKNIYRKPGFNRLRVKLTSPQKEGQPNNYYNRWGRTLLKAREEVARRVARGSPMFSPSPVKKASPKKIFTSPVKKVPLPKYVRRGLYKTKNVNGRLKIKGPTGTVVFVDGAKITVAYLKGIAKNYSVNVSNLKNKEAMARRIFMG
jgi:hypothetical protein